MGEKIVIGMSGGVDSSVAAAVLKQQGYDVVGLTMQLLGGGNSAEAEDAARVAERLGIEHYVCDFKEDFSRIVIDYFVNEYKQARTPNPCIVCNKNMKFGLMLKWANAHGAKYIATGHYAKVEYDGVRGRFLLKRALSDRKDQTYALYTLSQRQLESVVMPLGCLGDKTEVRKIAAELQLSTAGKSDSQEICFIPDNDYVSFIKRHTGYEPPPGNFVDESGNILGRHSGIINYTIGQRKGLGIAFGRPMFVTKINAGTNEITLGESGSEFSGRLTAEKLNFISIDEFTEPFRALAKIRYSARPALCIVSPMHDGRAEVVFDEPQRAVTPGQAVVFYETDSDIVIGGGTIIN